MFVNVIVEANSKGVLDEAMRKQGLGRLTRDKQGSRKGGQSRSVIKKAPIIEKERVRLNSMY